MDVFSFFNELCLINDLEKFKNIFEKNLDLIVKKDTENKTILHHLYKNSNLEIVKYVFKFFQSSNIFSEKDKNGDLPFMFFMLKTFELDIIKYIFDFYKNLNLVLEKDNYGYIFIDYVDEYYNLQIYNPNIFNYFYKELSKFENSDLLKHRHWMKNAHEDMYGFGLVKPSQR